MLTWAIIQSDAYNNFSIFPFNKHLSSMKMNEFKLRINNFVFIVSAILLFRVNDVSAQYYKLEPNDIEMMVRKDWQGSHSWQDEEQNKIISIPANAEIVSDGDRNLQLKISFPYEPKNNHVIKLKISKDLTAINNEPIMLREITEEGHVRIVTMTSGKEYGKKVQVYNSYILSPISLSMLKEVEIEGMNGLYFRQGYKFLRNY